MIISSVRPILFLPAKSYLGSYDRCDGPVVRASASQGRGFEPRPSHTKYFQKWYSLPSRLAIDK